MNAEALRAYCAAHPGLEITDVLKYIHQSCYGCAHLIADYEQALSQILAEAENASADAEHGIEDLPGAFCRAHLGILANGLRAETLAKLFILSAGMPVSGADFALNSALEAFLSLAGENGVPFAPDGVQAQISAWRNAGFPPCSHSDAFKALYHPAYRVMRKEHARILPLLARIDTLLETGPAVIAIDGRCASGKTTLAETLHNLYDCNVFHMDDFFLRPEQRTDARLREPGGNVDYERFKNEVLLPLTAGETVRYRRYDCRTQTVLPAEDIVPKRLTFVEGSYSHHPALKDYYTLTVATAVSPATQLARIAKRNTPAVAERFRTVWIPLEEAYFSACKVYETADLVLKNE